MLHKLIHKICVQCQVFIAAAVIMVQSSFYFFEYSCKASWVHLTYIFVHWGKIFSPRAILKTYTWICLCSTVMRLLTVLGIIAWFFIFSGKRKVEFIGKFQFLKTVAMSIFPRLCYFRLVFSFSFLFWLCIECLLAFHCAGFSIWIHFVRREISSLPNNISVKFSCWKSSVFSLSFIDFTVNTLVLLFIGSSSRILR